MCYNKETSIISYIAGVAASIYLFISGDKYDKNIAIFCLTFIQIQLVEFFMWLDQKCGIINKLATIFGNIILGLQPFSILLGAYLFNTTFISKNILIIALIINFIIVLNTIFYYILEYNKKICSKEKKQFGLSWDINYNENDIYVKILYFIGMFLVWLFYKNIKGIIIALIAFALLIKNLYDFKSNKVKYTWESHWCIESVSIPIIFITYNFIAKYLK